MPILWSVSDPFLRRRTESSDQHQTVLVYNPPARTELRLYHILQSSHAWRILDSMRRMSDRVYHYRRDERHLRDSVMVCFSADGRVLLKRCEQWYQVCSIASDCQVGPHDTRGNKRMVVSFTGHTFNCSGWVTITWYLTDSSACDL
jgi:hypothetical protein